jgi:hypothetical protein
MAVAAYIEKPLPPVEARSITDHLIVGGATATGIFLNQFVAEYIAQTQMATGMKAVAIKGIAKSIVSGIMLFLSTQVKGARLKAFFEYMGYGGLGTLILDVAQAIYPGGVTGAAATLALRGKMAAPVQRALTAARLAGVTPAPAPLLRPAAPLPAPPLLQAPAPAAAPAAAGKVY